MQGHITTACSKATDGGSKLECGLITGLTSTDILAVAIDPTMTPATLYAGTFQLGVFKARMAAGVGVC